MVVAFVVVQRAPVVSVAVVVAVPPCTQSSLGRKVAHPCREIPIVALIVVGVVVVVVAGIGRDGGGSELCVVETGWAGSDVRCPLPWPAVVSHRVPDGVERR